MVKLLVSALCVISLSACTTNGVELVNDQEVRVPAESYVKEGVKANVYETRCNMPMYSKMQRCWSEKTGEAQVVKVSGDTALVRAEGNTKFNSQSNVQWKFSR